MRLGPVTARCFVVAALISSTALAQNSTKAQPAKAATVSGAPAKIDQKTIDAALAEYRSNQYVEAEKHLSEVVATIAADTSPNNPLRNQLRECLEAIIQVEHSLGRNEAARDYCLQYHRWISGVFAKDPANRDPLLDQNAMNLADIYLDLDRAEDATSVVQSRMNQAKPNVKANPMRVLRLSVKLAQLAEAQDSAKAGALWTDVIQLGRQTINGVNGKPLPDDEFVRCSQSLARALVATNQIRSALAMSSTLYEFQLKHQKNLQAAIDTKMIIASHRAKLGEYGEATKLFEDMISDTNALAKSGREAEVRSLLAAVYDAIGSQSEARKQWEMAAAIDADRLRHLRTAPAENAQIMELLNSLQQALRQSQHFREAVDACQDLLKLRQASLGETHPLTIAAKADLGALYGQMEYYEAARPLLEATYNYWAKRTTTRPAAIGAGVE